MSINNKPEYKKCINCGRPVYSPEIDWCGSCIVNIMSSNSPQAFNLIGKKLPIDAQIRVAAYAGYYAQEALAYSPDTDTKILTYLLINSEFMAVRKAAVKRAEPRAIIYTMLSAQDAELVDACLKVGRSKNFRDAVLKAGQDNLDKIRKQPK